MEQTDDEGGREGEDFLWDAIRSEKQGVQKFTRETEKKPWVSGIITPLVDL